MIVATKPDGEHVIGKCELMDKCNQDSVKLNAKKPVIKQHSVNSF